MVDKHACFAGRTLRIIGLIKTSVEGYQCSLTFMIHHQRPSLPSSIYTVVNNQNHMRVVEDCVKLKSTTSVNLSEIRPIIFPSICLPEFKDREVKNLKWV